MSITFRVEFMGFPDRDDVRAERYYVELENRIRARRSPPGDPLPTGSAADLKSSYLETLSAFIQSMHAHLIEESQQPQK